MSGTILGLPINRFVTFTKPYINWLAGVVAAWLIAKVNIFGLAGLDQENVQTYVAAGVTLLLVTGLTQLGDLKWLKGHHIELADGAIAIREEEEALDAIYPEVAGAPIDTTIPPDETDRPG